MGIRINKAIVSIGTTVCKDAAQVAFPPYLTAQTCRFAVGLIECERCCVCILYISIVSQEGYIGEIKGGLRPSMKLVVMGIVDKKPKR